MEPWNLLLIGLAAVLTLLGLVWLTLTCANAMHKQMMKMAKQILQDSGFEIKPRSDPEETPTSETEEDDPKEKEKEKDDRVWPEHLLRTRTRSHKAVTPTVDADVLEACLTLHPQNTKVGSNMYSVYITCLACKHHTTWRKGVCLPMPTRHPKVYTAAHEKWAELNGLGGR